ncbi:hypothetical protein BC826DRAFT_48537 [Russula brevipes]|nr:hypothetical protein BC826DRAFT_48537 [Russula brevipes]
MKQHNYLTGLELPFQSQGRGGARLAVGHPSVALLWASCSRPSTSAGPVGAANTAYRNAASTLARTPFHRWTHCIAFPSAQVPGHRAATTGSRASSWLLIPSEPTRAPRADVIPTNDTYCCTV